MTTEELTCPQCDQLAPAYTPGVPALCGACDQAEKEARLARIEAERARHRAYSQEHNEGFCPACGEPVLFTSSLFGERPLIRCNGCGRQWMQAEWGKLNPSWKGWREK